MTGTVLVSDVIRQVIRLDELQPFPRNYNRHGDAQIARIAKSLSAFGQVRSIVTWRNTILAGHGVVLAARSLGWHELRADVLPDDYAEEMALAYVVADNELARQSDPDQEQLAALLQELEQTEPLLVEAAGYDKVMLEQLLRSVGMGNAVVDSEPQIDRAEELRQKWGVQSGDLWGMAEHRLICGDCTDAAVVARVMGGERAQLCFTSPPYNQELQSQSKPTGMHKENKWFHRLESAYSDAMPEDEYQRWQIDVLDLWFEFVDDGGACFYNHKHRYRDRRPIIPLEWIGRTRWQLRQEIIWDRRGGVAANANMFIPGDERIYWLEKDGDHIWNGIGNNRTTVWAMNPQANDGTHVCPFPIELASLPIEYVSNRGDLVADPFAGSGTTLIACQNLGRKCRAIEISAAYCAVAIERFHTATGIAPVRLEGG